MQKSAEKVSGKNCPKFKIFISYSRGDMVFVDLLVDALEARGFEVMIDRRSLPALEDWRRELLGLIRAADTMVFIISPRSVASPMCAWEIEQAAALNKRLAPVVLEPVGNDKIPDAVTKINYLFFDPPNGWDRQVEKLTSALNTDYAWLKEHTRIAELARRWVERGREKDDLMRGRALQDAKHWATKHPPKAPPLTEQQIEFLMDSQFAGSRRTHLTAVVGIISTITGSLSVVSLIKHGLDMGSFVAPIRLMLAYYEAAIHSLLGWWAEPILKKIIASLQEFVGWHLELDPSWKHIFVLMMLFFGSFTRQMAGSDRRVAIMLWTLGIAASVATSVFLGVAPIPKNSSDPVYILFNALIPAIPLIFVLIFFAGISVWYSNLRARIEGTTWSRVFLARPAVPIAAALLVVVTALTAMWAGGLLGDFSSDIMILLPLLSLPRPLIVALGFVAVAVLFVAWAGLNAFVFARRNGTSWAHEFKSNFWTSVAMSMFIVMLGAGMVLAFNAGLRLFFSQTGT